ncbi:MIG17-like protein [Mya arenaria]|uniref:MIG17-like protein n=1 Tax=Mya arenaria TaxID=6604 RepID=A0ABY7EKB0_MYAAR|nr:MIG17-like protein [Mya arenaria]
MLSRMKKQAYRRTLEAIAATPDVRRRRRRQATSLQVELLTVVDYKIYQFWYDLTKGSADRRTDTVNLIALYMAYMVNAVDARFRSVDNMDLSVLHAGLFIADTPEAAGWSEGTVTGGQQDSSKTLDAFTSWTNEQNGLPARDHAMAFTGYDITSGSSGSDNAGVAGLGTICSSESTSLVEWRFDFITMATAAHELAHSLGAVHDGSGNTCSADDSYIMAPRNSPGLPASKGRHPWLFSTCSQKSFKQRVDLLDAFGGNCLLRAAGSSRIATTPRPMGKTYGADETCVNRYGAGSFVCRSVQSYDAICRGMFCNQPGSTLCYAVVPAEGTPCGAGKWCERGVCVSSPQASSDVTDFCPLGDRPGLFEETGRTCADHVAADASACYSPYTEANCCKSCAARCEFGDKMAGCNKDHCGYYSADVRAGCCETCYDGIIPTTTTSTVRTNRPTTTMVPTVRTTTVRTNRPTTTLAPTVGTTTVRTNRSTTGPTVRPPTTSPPPMPTPTRPPTDRTPVAPQENTMSEVVAVALGVGAGALVLALVVAITCFLYRRQQASKSAHTKRDSIDNNYDNIGFIGAREKPARPPPRRASDNRGSAGSHTPQSTVFVDDYTLPVPSAPSIVSEASATSGVQYTAPEKPRFFAALRHPKLLRYSAGLKPPSAPEPSVSDTMKRVSRPVHYKRTSNQRPASGEVSVPLPGMSGDRRPSDAYDSIGDLPASMVSRKPTLPKNHPGKLTARINQFEKINSENHNYLTNANVQNNNTTKNKDIPHESERPKPVPRITSINSSQETIPTISASIAEPDLSIMETYDKADSVQKLDNQNVRPHSVNAKAPEGLVPPARPVPRRPEVVNEHRTGVPVPPKRPVPRRQSLIPPRPPSGATAGNQTVILI